MSMNWGMANRLARIIKSDGRAVMLAVDHGYFLGPDQRPGRTAKDHRTFDAACGLDHADARCAAHFGGRQGR